MAAGRARPLPDHQTYPKEAPMKAPAALLVPSTPREDGALPPRVPRIALGALLLQMPMHLALIDLLLVLAPLALLCWVLPQTKGWCRLSTSTFSGTVFTQLVQVATPKLDRLLLAELAP